MKIAIIGAGFSGLAVAHELSKQMGHKITVFDKHGIGGAASGIAAGLMHPFAGKKCTLNWNGFVAYREALTLFDIASRTLGKEVVKKSGIYRVATTLELEMLYKIAAKRYPECILQQYHHPDLLDLPGLFIPMGVQVDCPLYLEGLAKACSEQGVTFEIALIDSVKALSQFDLLLFALGTDFNTVADLVHPQVHAVKGQLIEFSYDGELPFAISSQNYIAQVRKGVLVAGATYEHHWETPLPDLRSCEDEIRSKVAQFSPKLSQLPVSNCYAGFRATTPDKMPFIKKTGPNIWCIGGLGSKGLLYHAWLALRLVEELAFV